MYSFSQLLEISLFCMGKIYFTVKYTLFCLKLFKSLIFDILNMVLLWYWYCLLLKKWPIPIQFWLYCISIQYSRIVHLCHPVKLLSYWPPFKKNTPNFLDRGNFNLQKCLIPEICCPLKICWHLKIGSPEKIFHPKHI